MKATDEEKKRKIKKNKGVEEKVSLHVRRRKSEKLKISQRKLCKKEKEKCFFYFFEPPSQL